VFQIKLKELREKHQLSQAALARMLGVSQSTVGMWENGKNKPEFDTLKKISTLFEVPVAYLVGDIQALSSSETRKGIAKRVLEASDKMGVSPKDVLSKHGIAADTIDDMLAGRYEYSIDTLRQIANYFDVSVDYLLGTEKEKTPALEGERKISDSDLMFGLWGNSDEVDEDDLADVKRYAAFVRERKRERGK
jgi:hypothetical protein